MPPSRNFRTTYYKTLGVPVVQHLVDVEASYQALFSEPVINTAQLIKLALEVGIAPSYRASAWKVLSGVLPPHKSLWEMAEHERQEMYEDLADAIRVLQLQCRSDARPTTARQDHVEVHEEDSAERLVRFYQTYRTDVLRATPLQIFDGFDRNDRAEAKRLEDIALVVQNVFPDAMSDQFWCFTRILAALDDASSILDSHLVSEALNDMSVHSLEVIFIRALDGVKNGTRI